MSRDDLIAAGWDGWAVGDDAIDRCIAAIRRLAQPHGGFSITTVARLGFSRRAALVRDRRPPNPDIPTIPCRNDRIGDSRRPVPAPVRIWLEIAHHGAFRIGGWAFVRLRDGAVSGAAGGARRIDLERTALRAIAAALSGLTPGEPVELHTASPAVLAIPRRIAEAETGESPPTEELELWARAAGALRRPGLVVSPAISAPGTPIAFAAAWADLACDRAKTKGEFAAPIPKHNLAKAGV